MLRRILSISLALLVLLSSVSVSISEHLCGDRVVSKALFGKARSCGMEAEGLGKIPCPMPSGIAKGKCCNDHQTVIPGVQDLADFGADKPVQDASPVFITPAIPAILHFGNGLFASSVKPLLTDYHPPQRIRDLPVLLQVFRI